MNLKGGEGGIRYHVQRVRGKYIEYMDLNFIYIVRVLKWDHEFSLSCNSMKLLLFLLQYLLITFVAYIFRYDLLWLLLHFIFCNEI